MISCLYPAPWGSIWGLEIGELTDSKVKALKAQAKPQKVFDGHALYLLVSPAGGKHWKLKYRLGGSEHTLSLGAYPAVGVARARVLASEARSLIAAGIHPIDQRREMASARAAQAANTLGAVVEDWITENKSRWSVYYAKQVRTGMDRYILASPALAGRPIRDVTATDIRMVLRSIAKRTVLKEPERKLEGSVTTAINVRTWCRGVFAFAIERELADTDPTWALRNLTELRRSASSIKHNKKLSPSGLQDLLARMETFSGDRLTALALRLLTLTFVRTGELRQATWGEFDLKVRQWRIPAARMKAKRPHLVPLSRQAITALEELRLLSAADGYLFPNRRDASRCMSATTVNRALERMGVNGRGTIGFAAHGFRGTASTLLHEHGFPPNVIELQLAHAPRDQVKAAYNDAQHVDSRTQMMQGWSDYVDSLVSPAPHPLAALT